MGTMVLGLGFALATPASANDADAAGAIIGGILGGMAAGGVFGHQHRNYYNDDYNPYAYPSYYEHRSYYPPQRVCWTEQDWGWNGYGYYRRWHRVCQ